MENQSISHQLFIICCFETTNITNQMTQCIFAHMISHVYTVYVDYGVVIMLVTLAVITVIGSPFFEVLKLSICLCSTPIFLRAWWRLRLWGSPWSVNSASEFCLLGHDRATPSPPGGDKAAMASAHMQCTCSWFWLSKTGIINWPPWTGYWNVNISWIAILCYF